MPVGLKKVVGLVLMHDITVRWKIHVRTEKGSTEAQKGKRDTAHPERVDTVVSAMAGLRTTSLPYTHDISLHIS